jgi:tRNA dimethylallyltransferase
MTKLLIVCGPTATGKTALAVKLAKQFNGELISADSRQVYKGMDIVTGKDRPKGVVIHGLDLIEPDEDFSVAHFVESASNSINQISLKSQLPIIVGGTGLYIDSLVNPPATLAVGPDWELRQQLEQKTVEELQAQLKKLDPGRWHKMNHSDQLNPRRLIRAIEVGLKGELSKAVKTDYDCLWIGLTLDKEKLDQLIAARVKARVKAGAIKEWQILKAKYSNNLPSMSGIGYRQLPDIDAWVKAEQQYARRQLTYFKKNEAIHWFGPEEVDNIVNLVAAWYTRVNYENSI